MKVRTKQGVTKQCNSPFFLLRGVYISYLLSLLFEKKTLRLEVEFLYGSFGTPWNYMMSIPVRGLAQA